MFRQLARRTLATATATTTTKVATAAATQAAAQVSTADVTIIGAGPAGLSLGAALKNSPITRHLKIKIIESMPLIQNLDTFETNTPDKMTNRVVSLTPMTIDFFNKIGSWNLMKNDRIQSYDEMIIIDGVSDAKLELAHDEIATMAETINIQNSLYQRINELANDDQGIEIIDNTKVVNIKQEQEATEDADAVEGQSSLDWPIVELSTGEQIQTRLLIGCDGANSPVRTFAQIEKRGWGYDKWGVVATLSNEYESFKLPTAWQRFLPTGPIAFLPLPNNETTLVWSTTPELSVALIKAPEEVFVKMLNCAYRLDTDELNYLYDLLLKEHYDSLIENMDWRLTQFNKNKTIEQLDDYPIPIKSINPTSRARFPLRMTHADTYVSSRVALVGDAAHTVHPLAGQGLNLGQADVASLCMALEKACNRGIDIGSMLALEPYFSDRYPANHVMLGICDKLHKVYSNDLWPVVMGRTVGVNVLNQLTFIKDLLIQNVSGK